MSVREYVGQYGGLDESSLHELAVVSAAALASLHEAGHMHGDLGPDAIVLGPEGPRMVSGRPLVQDQPPGPAADGEPEDRLSPGQARDVFAWAVTMVFAAGGSLEPGVLGGGDDDMAGIAGQPEVPVSMRAVLRECLSEPRYRPSARRVLQWMARGQFPASGYRIDVDGHVVGGDGRPVGGGAYAAGGAAYPVGGAGYAAGGDAYAMGGGGYPIGGDGYPAPPAWSGAPTEYVPAAYGPGPGLAPGVGAGAGRATDHAAPVTQRLATARASDSWSGPAWSGPEPAAPTMAMGAGPTGFEPTDRMGHTASGLRHAEGGPERTASARSAGSAGGRFSTRTLVLSVLALIAVAAATGGGGRDLNALFQSVTGRQTTPPVATAQAATAGTPGTQPNQAAQPNQPNQATQPNQPNQPNQANGTNKPNQATQPNQNTPTAAPSAAGTATPRLTGQWQGTLAQSDSPNRLRVQLVLRGTGGQMILPALGCTGNLTVQTSAQGRTVFLDQLTTDARGRCAASGTVTISRLSPSTLQLRWVNNAPPFNSAKGVLRKA